MEIRIKLGVLFLRLGHWLLGQKVSITYRPHPKPQELEEAIRKLVKEHANGKV